MYILTQDQKRIVNTENAVMIEIERNDGGVYAILDEFHDEYVLLGKYEDAKGALLDIFIALRNGTSSYEMPQSV